MKPKHGIHFILLVVMLAGFSGNWVLCEEENQIIKGLKKKIAENPDDEASHKAIAQEYLREENRAAAVPHLRELLRINNEPPESYMALVQSIVRTEDGQSVDPEMARAAQDVLKHASNEFPESPQFPYFASQLYRSQQKWKEATRAAKRTERIAKQHRPAILDEYFYFGFASSAERAGNLTEAEKLFRKSINLLNKNQPDGKFEGDHRKFAAQLYNYLGYMWLENDMKLDEAGKHIKKAIEFDPKSGAIADSMGWFHFKQGKLEEAKQELLRASELMREPDPVVLDHLAQTLFQLGRKMEATLYLEKAVKLDPKNKELSRRLQEYRSAKKK